MEPSAQRALAHLADPFISGKVQKGDATIEELAKVMAPFLKS
jgi:hypothetical protein